MLLYVEINLGSGDCLSHKRWEWITRNRNGTLWHK